MLYSLLRIQRFRSILPMIILLCLAASSGCMVGPNFQRPQEPVPARWSGPLPPPSPQPVTLEEKELSGWWTVFDDRILSSLIDRAVQSNLDLKLAEARIRQARAARGIAASGLGPTVDASGAYSRNQLTGSSSNEDTKGPITNQYQAGFDASWELDVFGGVRRGVEAAGAGIQVAVENRRNVLVTLTAEVARNYIELRVFQQRIAIARQNLQAQEHSAKLTRQRFQFGFVSGLDVANAEALVATTAAQIPLLEASARQSIYNLSVLLGLDPATLVQELSPALAIPVAPPSVPMGVPSDLLRRRPDILSAEAGIHAATAQIGVATADLFPKFFLFGSGGYQASQFSSWLEPASLFWSIGPSVSWPVFDTGRIRSNIEVQKALAEQSLIVYRQTVLAALQETENALVASAKEQEHRKALVDAVAANRKAVELSLKLYTEGQTDFLNVLQAQRSLYETEDALVQSNGAVSTDLVALYKALGGGWDISPKTSPPNHGGEGRLKGTTETFP
jgi:multidrug efflux system outer membrane protein